jgi:benzoate/toluate 1,2-dioxygenase alpha subunit
MIVDQAPDGIEVLRGIGAYTFDANWKLQAENGADGYHVTAVHWNYAATQGRRTADGKEDTIKAMSAGGWARQGGGSYSFKNGHMLLWTNWANPEDRPCGTSATSGSPSSAKPRPTGCSRSPATCASTRTSI